MKFIYSESQAPSVSRHQCVHYRLNVQFFEMRVLLPHSHKNNRLACGVNHVEGGANFLVHRIKLSHDNAINRARIVVLHGKVNQRLVELGQLID